MLVRALGLLLLIFPPLLWAASVQSQPWKPAIDQGGISIQTRKQIRGLVAIRAQMQVHTSFAAFMLLLEDSANVPHWIDNVSSSRVLRQLSSTENIVYTRFSAPWPTQDRDMVTYSSYTLNNNALVLTITDASERYPELSRFVRIKAVKATWTLEKLSNGLTQIDYVAFADPGGMLPNWLINKLAVTSAFNTFAGLRAQLPKYQNRKHPVIKQ